MTPTADPPRGTTETRTADVCVVGAGPGGLALALELARRGVSVIVVERTARFERSFRGESISPDSVWLLDRLGVLGTIRDRIPIRPTRRFEIVDGGDRVLSVDFARLAARFASRHRFPVELPQPVLLNALADAATARPGCVLLRRTTAAELLQRDGRIAGVRCQGPDGTVEVRAALTVGADGRYSRIRTLAGLSGRKVPLDRDVLWCRLPLPPGWDPHTVRVRIRGDEHALLLPTHPDMIRVGLNIPKGGYRTIRAEGIEAVRSRLAALAPELAGDLEERLTDWSQVGLLDIFTTIVPTWHRPGLVLIGDAAHTLSPVLGQGVNHAIIDAVTLAPLVARALDGPPGAAGTAARLTAASERFQRLREPAVRRARRLQMRQERAFALGGPALVRARRGLYRLIDRTPPLKRRIWQGTYYTLRQTGGPPDASPDRSPNASPKAARRAGGPPGKDGTMPHSIDGRRVLLTGASSGIGRALARALAARGAVLALAARSEEPLSRLADEVERAGGRRPAVLVTDLSVRGAAEDLARRAREALGGVDVLINNAGVGVSGYQWAVGDRDEGREVFETNFWSPLALVRALLPEMRRRGDGTVVMVTSMMQYRSWPGLGHYSASKAALALATETLRLELADCGVRVLEVTPGPVDTPILAEVRHAPGSEYVLKNLPVVRAEDVAAATVRALERGRARLVYPRKLTVAVYLPALVRAKALRLVRRAGAGIDRTDERVLRSGSAGDPVARAAREAWAREHPPASAVPARRKDPA
ncbi:hypothetical protein GCM10023085_31620 [Actinomadura viridis]|uniref:2-polyprenyl-6-methoxyphenol hydroxylase-like FAD-dependent oxidoreductase/NADP-dependent 3-hydroxy acid dehydrogenase YdfG n=1 Tax=Actinomadura viridis TaxID=58110 RepID=A0A931DDH2_9ACTN|nr:SDR family NAD(P)-dependent oxidoreductase [Actinomadura viridis]MBG6086844.1 2-polyprenyl-6-methoxyphenol hydroxylase-like FAD-dependent oxidoreductase/NADP-dependent 3-hydroxy acid dehydrogenase YdfG [Actinomadura viridis]